MTATTTATTRLKRSLSKLAALEASPEQKLYVLAKANLAATKALIARDIAALGPKPVIEDGVLATSLIWGIGEGGIYSPTLQHPYFRERDAIEDRHKLHDAQSSLWEAEKLLVDWARENARRAAATRPHLNLAAVLPVFDRWNELETSRQQDFLDLCSKMEVER